MRRRIVNRHKIERNFRRKVKSSRRFLGFLFDNKKNKSQKDFSWQGQTRNPYKPPEKKNRGLQIKIGTIILSFLIIVLVSVYSSFFHLTNINIDGLQRIDKAEIDQTVKDVLGCEKFSIIPQKSYFTANIDELRDVITAKYPIESIIIKKTFPNKISIILEEELSTLIYDNGENYSYIGLDGNVVEIMRKVGEYEWDIKTEITTSTNESGEIETHKKEIGRTHKPDIKSITNELGDYPVVYDKREKETGVNIEVVTEKEVRTIVEWFNLLTKTTDIPLKYFVIQSEVGELTVYTYEGWYIKSKFDRSVPTQLEELQTLFKEKIERDKVNYVDLRYEGRVYWK